MRYFDCHLHLASPDDGGFSRFIEHIEADSSLVGCNLILNSEEEVVIVARRMAELPQKVVVVPPLSLDFDVPDQIKARRWWKIHPTIHRINRDRIPELIRHIGTVDTAGIMVHHFPWGDQLEYNTSLELIIEIARSFPQLPVVATHGGGYESWKLRAHTARLSNVYYDFSMTFATYAGTDYLKPWTQYVQHRRNRILFGSDWPSAEAGPQLREAVHLAEQSGFAARDLENQLLENSAKLWPHHVSGVRHE